MEHNTAQSMHDHHRKSHTSKAEAKNNFILALNSTLHCSIGCGIGEVLSMIIGNALNISMINTIIPSLMMGFAAALPVNYLMIKRGVRIIINTKNSSP